MKNTSSAQSYFNPHYPDISYLRDKAKRRIPGFAFDYLDGGCNAEVNLRRNTEKIREVLLEPSYIKKYGESQTTVSLFGQEYNAPFGIAPIGLQGLMWPGASEILAKAAFDNNIPYILSTVGTASLEAIAEITEGNAWFQLYHPKEEELRDDLLRRAEEAGYKVLVLLSDVPTFGYRSKEIKNGLAIPPRMTLRNVVQIMSRPNWALSTLFHGQPKFKTLLPYLPKGMSLRHLGLFMNQTFSGKLNEDRVAAIRDKWKGKLVMKGVASLADAQTCIKLGIDGLIVSNHGGRQLDAGEATIESLARIVESVGEEIPVMMDSGIRTGADIASVIASGAQFAFLGRSFMYGVSALGKNGGEQVYHILSRQFKQVMDQLCCEKVYDLQKHLIQ